MTVDPVYLPARFDEGRSGDWRLERFEVSPSRVAGADDRRPEWARCPPGRYLRLAVGKTVMMTDTREEWTTQRHAVTRACTDGGKVLVSGLGLGVVVDSMLQSPGSRVEHVTVVEAYDDVIQLVGTTLAARYGDRITIVHADAFRWTPPARARYTVAWHDIWPNPHDPRILVEMDRLEHRYAPYCAWQGCWGRELAEGRREPLFDG